MFLECFGLREQPFGVTPDPRFLYLGKSHREALASLYYGVESDRGFVSLIARPGLGKTTLTFQLLEKLQQASRTLFLFHTKCNPKEFFHYLLTGLGVDSEGMELVSMHNKLNQILCREMLAGRRLVLAIDEAQNLDMEVLETIRLLSNFETSRQKMLQILLIGQPQLGRKLAKPELEQLQQRISVYARLEPFDLEETGRYIAHRLQIAGYMGNPLFDDESIRIISEHSQGVPRKINGLCFSALSLACALGRKQVDAAILQEVVADRDVESFEKHKAPQRVAPPPAVPRPPEFSPMLARSVLTSYQADRPARSFGRWATGVAMVAASVVIGFAGFFFSPDRIDRSLQVSAETFETVRNAAASVRGVLTAKTDSVPLSSALDVQAAEFPNGAAAQSASSDDTGIETAIVQPGETLRQLILRTLGEYNDETVKEVRRLNPAIADLDHLETGQLIRLRRVFLPSGTSTGGEGAGSAIKN